MRTKTIFLTLTALTIAVLMGSSQVSAQSGGAYELTSTSIAAGGGAMTGGAYGVISAIGQPEAGAITQSGGDYALTGGIWDGSGTAYPPPVIKRAYLPVLLR